MKTVPERASAYLAKMPVAVAGQGGHAAAFEAAAVLVKGFGLSPEEALPLLQQWNQHCLPPWSQGELRQKLRSAATTSCRSVGYLLEDSSTITQQRQMSDLQREEERRASQRRHWPELRPPCSEELAGVARLRGIPQDGVLLASRHGLIKAASFEGHPCFVIHEGTFAQARRYDGQPLLSRDGRTIKAKNLPGSAGGFIGRCLLRQAPHVLLVEGAIGLVEALTAFCLADRKKAWTVLAATSASSRFARDPALLKMLADRHVRILPDADEAGMNAAASWMADLRAVGARVEVLALPAGHKDLGTLIAEPETHRETLTSLFQ